MDRETVGGSDHRPVVAELDLDRAPVIVVNATPESWNRWKLRDQETREKYQKHLEASVEALWAELTPAFR